MSDSLWNRVVTVEMDGCNTHYVRTSREAAWCLLDEWHAEKGVFYGKALVACAKALEGKAPDAVARFLFESAAREANFLVKTSADIREHDPVLADLTEIAFRDLLGV
jgi:hypothetical protein